jgi:hypothetical protein
MLLEVKNRSPESWGPLAAVDQKTFDGLINKWDAKDEVKAFVKKQKKLKPYNVTFERRSYSESFEIMAEDNYDVGVKARAYYKENADKISFKEQQRSNWADGYAGYDNIHYSKVRT